MPKATIDEQVEFLKAYMENFYIAHERRDMFGSILATLQNAKNMGIELAKEEKNDSWRNLVEENEELEKELEIEQSINGSLQLHLDDLVKENEELKQRIRLFGRIGMHVKIPAFISTKPRRKLRNETSGNIEI